TGKWATFATSLYQSHGILPLTPGGCKVLARIRSATFPWPPQIPKPGLNLGPSNEGRLSHCHFPVTLPQCLRLCCNAPVTMTDYAQNAASLQLSQPMEIQDTTPKPVRADASKTTLPQPGRPIPSRAYPGALIVVEGTDGSGKSTQLYLLKRWLEIGGYRLHFTEWNSSPLVKSATRRGKQKRLLTPTTYSLLHASDFADRCERQIMPLLQGDYLVLADRYIYTASRRFPTSLFIFVRRSTSPSTAFSAAGPSSNIMRRAWTSASPTSAPK